MTGENATTVPQKTASPVTENLALALNTTDVPNDESPPIGVFRSQAVFYVVIASLIILGNLLVIAAVLRYRFLQTPTNLFVVGVAGVDSAVGISSVLVAIQLLLPGSLGQSACLVRVGFSCINLVSSAMLFAGRLHS